MVAGFESSFCEYFVGICSSTEVSNFRIVDFGGS